jgi:hypothetical protein
MPDIILTGPPRSGTTLACYLLNKVPDTVALHEPMNRAMFPDPASGRENIRTFFGRMRQSLLQDGTALSKVAGDKIPDNPFTQTRGGERASIVAKKTVHFDKALRPDFHLVIKHNAHFTFLLRDLVREYPCYTVIRNPVSVIASWNTIDAPVARGNLSVLETLHPALYRELEGIPDLLTRQVRLADTLFACYLDLPGLTVIRYEDIIASGGRALAPVVPAAASLSEPLESRNRSALYDEGLLDRIRDALLRAEGAWSAFYPGPFIENP